MGEQIVLALKILSMNNELVIRTDKEELPYIFQVGDQIKISSEGEIITERRDSSFKVEFKPRMDWLHFRVNELTWKIQHATQNGNFVSQTDVYERNYLLEIINQVGKEISESND